jgi:FAD binding domain
MSDKNVAVKAAVLVVGTGPAGGTAALALARLGVDVMVINKYPWTAPTPRAHITNQRTVEVLRDLGLADEALALATPNDSMGENTYCTSLAGEELGRLRTWGTQPQRRSDYELASPLGLFDTQDREQMRRNMAAIKGSSHEAAARRIALREAIDQSDYVYNCHGVEMNQRYISDAVVGDGSEPPKYRRDPELYYESTSFPGARLPHGWVARNGARVSTLALCGGGEFTLLTGLGGEAWVEAASRVGAQYGVPIRCQIIGPGCAIEDPHGDFARIREVGESGALLIRPDVYVGWRAKLVSADATDRLRAAMATILAVPLKAVAKRSGKMVAATVT